MIVRPEIFNRLKMHKFSFLLFVVFFACVDISAQITDTIAPKVTIGVHPNIETYFIAERLAVQHIDTYVFTQKDSLYAHQPMVYFTYKHFKKYVNTACILRISELLLFLRDNFHDNAQTIEYLLFQKSFPEKGERYPFKDSAVLNLDKLPKTMAIVKELTDSLLSFYNFAKVDEYLKQNASYYRGALREVKKDIRKDIFPFMEKYYGEQFSRYTIYIMPMMPITVGEDNYRAFGPTLHFPEGRVSVMVFSSSKMLALPSSLRALPAYGFDNHEITHFLTVHEIGHSFVNPHMSSMKKEIDRDTALFTQAWQKILQPSYIWSWENCVVEHLVRLGEIRIALAMKDTTEANRLRNLHIKDFKFVLLPLLEKKIETYEAHRDHYPNFNSFLPELFKVFHSLTPDVINKLVSSL